MGWVESLETRRLFAFALPPSLSITDASGDEGDSGQTDLVFFVTRSGNTASETRVDFKTQAISATGNVDYDNASGTLIFTPGKAGLQIPIQVNGDTTVEPDETFRIVLSNPVNATIADDEGVGTIQNDDVPPALPEISVSVFGEEIGGITDGQSNPINFGSANQNADEPTVTFVVRNTGDALLTVGTPSVPSGYSLVEPLSGPLPPGQSDEFTVALSTGSPGTKNGSISFSNNDSNENPFNFPITGNVIAPPAPEITVSLQGGGSISDGQSSSIDFGAIDQGGPGGSKTFVVKNDGDATLTLGTPTLPSGYSLTSSLAQTLDPGASDTFQVTLSSFAAGTKTGSISFSNNDANENPFNFPIKGTVNAPAAPEISVSVQGGSSITDGTSNAVSFGTIQQGAAGASKTFVVKNDGNATLTLGTPSVPAGYSITSSLSTSLAAGASDTFTVTLASDAVGDHNGSISFSTNDTSENPFNFPITGTVAAPSEPEISVSVQGGADVTDGQSSPVSFGAIDQGAADVSMTFVVTNDGNAPLALGTPTVPAGYSITSSLATSLAAGASDTFTVTLSSANLGTQSGSISFATNDSNENPFDIPITGTVVAPGAPPAPEIAVMAIVDQTATPITDGQSTPINFGATPIGQAGAEHAFTVTNAGNAALSLTLGELPAGFEVVDGLIDNVAPGESDTFTVRVSASAPAGPLSGAINIANNDADEDPFDIPIAATVGVATTPEPVPVEEFVLNGVPLTPGQVIDFGTRAADDAPTVIEVMVHYIPINGSVSLGAISLPAGFTLADPQPTTIGPGNTATVRIAFSASTPGTFNGTATIPLIDDAARPSFALSFTGVAGPPATIAVTSVTASKLSPSIVAGDPKAAASLSVTIQNNGDADFSGPVAFAIHASLDDALDAGDGKALLAITKTMHLKAGATGGIKLNVPLTEIPLGTQKLLVTATADNADSTKVGPSVTVAQPFVSLTAPPISPGPKKPLKFGKKGLFTLALQNLGNIPTTPGVVNYTLIISPDTTEAAGVFTTTTTGKVKLKAGTIKPQKLKVLFPAGSFAAGNYYALVKLNAEMNQTNDQVITAIPFIIG